VDGVSSERRELDFTGAAIRVAIAVLLIVGMLMAMRLECIDVAQGWV